MSCICHVSLQLSDPLTGFRSQRRCNNRLCGDAEPCSNLQHMCNNQQQHVQAARSQHVHDIHVFQHVPTCSNMFQHVPSCKRKRHGTETLHLLVANLASASNSSKSQLSPGMDCPWICKEKARDSGNTWATFGQHLGTCRVQTHRFT